MKIGDCLTHFLNTKERGKILNTVRKICGPTSLLTLQVPDATPVFSRSIIDFVKRIGPHFVLTECANTGDLPTVCTHSGHDQWAGGRRRSVRPDLQVKRDGCPGAQNNLSSANGVLILDASRKGIAINYFCLNGQVHSQPFTTHIC